MGRLMHKKYRKNLIVKHLVLLFINLALGLFCFGFLFFTKIVSTLYTGLYISFLFSHINITHPKNGTTATSEKSTKGKKQYKTPNKHQRRGAHPKHGLLVF